MKKKIKYYKKFVIEGIFIKNLRIFMKILMPFLPVPEHLRDLAYPKGPTLNSLCSNCSTKHQYYETHTPW